MRQYIELLESMSYAVLLTENERAEFLIKTYGERIEAKWKLESPHEPANVRQGVESQPYESIPQKVIGYVATQGDPTKNKKFTQWLVTRWLKDGLRMEDLPRAVDALTAFIEKQRTLAKKDINQYPALQDVEAVVRERDQVVQQAQDEEYTKALSESKLLHNDARWLVVIPQTKFAACYFGRPTEWCTAWGDPKGRHPTRRDNQFDYYHGEGPLYIIIDRQTEAKNQTALQADPHARVPHSRWQFHFERNQFMDTDDRSIDMASFFREHPEIMHIIGEDKFLPLADRIGIEAFSPEARKRIGAKQAAHMVHSKEDFLAVPEETRNSPDFLRQLLTNVAGRYGRSRLSKQDVFSWLTKKQMLAVDQQLLARIILEKEQWDRVPPQIRDTEQFLLDLLREGLTAAFAWYLPTMTEEKAIELLEVDADIFSMFPDEWKTTKNALKAASYMDGWVQINREIPKELWGDEIWQRYVGLRAEHDTYSYRISDVPEQYRTPEVVETLVSRRVEDAKNAGPNLTEDAVIRILRSRPDSSIINHLPPRLHTQAIVETAMAKLNDKANYYSRDMVSVLGTWPQEAWTPELVIALFGRDDLLNFTDVPQDLRTPEVARYYLKLADQPYIKGKRHKRQTIPAQYLDDEIVADALSNEHFAGQRIPREALTDAAVLAAIEKIKKGEGKVGLEAMGQNLRHLSLPVAQVLVDEGVLALASVPPEIMSADVVRKRFGGILLHYGEKDSPKHIPDKVLDEDLAVYILSHDPGQIDGLPSRLLTTRVLEAWLGKLAGTADKFGKTSGYRFRQNSSWHGGNHNFQFYQTQLERFPKKALTPKAYADAVRLDLHPSEMDATPKHLLDAGTASALLAKNAENYEKLPAELLSDDVLAHAVERNRELVETIPLDRWTEPVIYSAMVGHAAYSKLGPDENHHRSILIRLPRDKWSYRVYDEAVGRVVPLSEVPQKHRDDNLIGHAIDRVPDSVAVLRNPAKWLNENKDRLTKLKDDKKKVNAFLLELEKAGVLRTRKGYVNVEELDRKTVHTNPLPEGYSYSVVSSGPSNIRLYLFKDRKLVVNFWTEKDKVRFPSALMSSKSKYSSGYMANWATTPDAKQHRDALFKLAQNELGSFNTWDLNHLRIYGEGRGGVWTEEGRSRKKVGDLEWSTSPSFDGSVMTAWLNDQPILRAHEGSKKAAFGRKTSAIVSAEVLDHGAALEHSVAILKTVEKDLNGYVSDLRRIGFVFKKGGTETVAERKVGKVGKFTVWRGGENVARFGISTDKGMIATAVLRKNGKVDNLDVLWDYRNGEEKISEIMDQVAAYLRAHPNGEGVAR